MGAIDGNGGLVRPLNAVIAEAATLLYVAIEPALAADGEGSVALALIPQWDNGHLGCIQLGREVEPLRIGSWNMVLDAAIAAHAIDALEYPAAGGCGLLAIDHRMAASPAVV